MSEPNVSPAKLAANRRNAQRSTGPRTAAGKARSAANSTRHSAYARELYPLETGPLAEDARQFYERAEALVAGFDPNDDLEAELAKRGASVLMRMKRLDMYEAAMNEITAMPDHGVDLLCGNLRAAEHEEFSAVAVQEFLEAHARGRLDELDYLVYSELASDLAAHIPGGGVIPGVWDETHKPTTEEEWKDVVEKLVASISPDPEVRMLWGSSLRSMAYLVRAEVERKTKAMLARRLISSEIENLERPRNALWREFNQVMTQLGALRTMRRAQSADAEDDAQE
jgi:hypothetical protein